MVKPIKVAWSKNQIHEVKAEVKKEIDAGCRGETDQYRLNFIQSNIEDLETQFEPTAQLKRLIYIISALVHHDRFGGLSDVQVERLSQVAEAIIQTHGIKPGSSKLGFLFGELHFVRSQIYRKRGSHWRSAWEQHVGILHTRPGPLVGGDSFQLMAMANRALRLANTTLAIQHYLKAEDQGLSDDQLALARIGRIRALRLSGDLQQSRQLADETSTLEHLTMDHQLELGWERLCRNVTEKNDMTTMLKAIRKRGSHYRASYLWEGFMWAASSSNINHLNKTIKLKNLMRVKELKPHHLGYFMDCGIMLERCYDSEYPLVRRYEFLGNQLFQAENLLNVDKVLLLWAAASRWLFRRKAFALASLTLNEYRALSMRLSNAKQPDVLGLTADLMEKSWFTGDEQKVA